MGGCESWRGVVRGDALEAAAPCDGEAGDQDQESSRVWARGFPGTDVERDAWAGWPARIAAIIGADLGVDAHRMQTVLETHVRAHLGELSDPRIESGGGPDLR